MKLFKVLCYLVAAVCVWAGLWPLLFGIFHIGNVVLLLMGVTIGLLPYLLKKTEDTKRLRRGIVAVYTAGVLTVVALSGVMLYEAYGHVPPENGRQTLIVLGSKVNGDRPSLMLKRRLNVARDYLKENPQSDVIVSGGQGEDEDYPEGEVMARYLVGEGIDPERIIIENRSTNTDENLRFSKELMPEDSEGVIIVSDNYHQARARIIAKNIGIEPLYSLSSQATWGIALAYWFRDMGGVPLFWLKGML